MTTKRFENLVAIVTGGSRGIGEAVVKELLEEGAKVAVCSNDGVNGKGAFLKLCSRSDTAALVRQYVVDMGDPSGIQEFVEDIVECLGPPQVLVNNAAVMDMYHSAEASLDVFERCIQVNVRGYWLLAKTVFPYMKRLQEGAIVNIGSTHAYQTRPNSFPYNVSKGAVSALNRAMALDFGSAGIRVNSVVPGIVNTKPTRDWIGTMENASAKMEAIQNSHTLLRMPTVDEIARAVLFLASSDSSGITGIELVVDAGRSIKRCE